MQTKFSASRALLLFVVLLIDGTNVVNGLSDNLPISIQDVHTDLRGPDSFVIFFMLRDNTMADSISDGSVTIEIIQPPYMSTKGGPTVLFNQTREVKRSDFNESSHGRRYYCFGPISNSQFNGLNPMGANYAVVNIYFMTPDGQVLSNKCELPIPL